ncbi:hypothetical protein V8E36_006462, partial [Tilletia maclaganii]
MAPFTNLVTIRPCVQTAAFFYVCVSACFCRWFPAPLAASRRREVYFLPSFLFFLSCFQFPHCINYLSAPLASIAIRHSLLTPLT